MDKWMETGENLPISSLSLLSLPEVWFPLQYFGGRVSSNLRITFFLLFLNSGNGTKGK